MNKMVEFFSAKNRRAANDAQLSRAHNIASGNPANTANAASAASAFLLHFILQAQRKGLSCLPLHLGLSANEFAHLVARLDLSGAPITIEALAYGSEIRERSELRQHLLELRRDEWYELRNLLQNNAVSHSDFDPILKMAAANIIATGCLGGDHLWRDLGFVERAQLNQFMTLHFPKLAELNSKDMKWKKFFYKQLCEQGGGYVCRSPSCEECSTYELCFGPED